MVTLVRRALPNAPFPMYVTLLGMVTLVTFEMREAGPQGEASILVTPSGMVTRVAVPLYLIKDVPCMVKSLAGVAGFVVAAGVAVCVCVEVAGVCVVAVGVGVCVCVVVWVDGVDVAVCVTVVVSGSAVSVSVWRLRLSVRSPDRSRLCR